MSLALPVSSPPPPGPRGFVSGFSAFMVGLKLVVPGGGLFRYAIAPVLVCAFVMLGLAVGAFFGARHLLLEWLEQSWIGWLGGALAFVLAVLLAYFLFVPVMSLFAPLFIDPICERVYARYTGRELIGEKSAAHFIRRQLFAIVQSIKWLLIVLLIQIPLTIGAMLTGVLALAAVPVGAVIMGADLMDYPLALKHYTLKGKLGWARGNFWAAFGLGVGASLFLLIPFANLFVVPAGAAAATILAIATEAGELKTPEQT
jgi:CysZ protein